MTEEKIVEIGARAIDPDAFDEERPDLMHRDLRRATARDQMRTALAALRAAGCAVVPVEPSGRMLNLGHCEVTAKTDVDESCWITTDELATAYCAMIRAATESK